MNRPIRCFEGNARPHEPFWTVRNVAPQAASETASAELEFYGYISEYSWYEDDITPRMFKDALNALGGAPLTVRLNSGGGDVIAASVIRAALLDYPGPVTVRIDGLAASAAVIVAMAGKRVLIQDTAYMMIHDPAYSVMYADLDIATLAAMLDQLKSIKAGIVDTYQARTGISADRLARMMGDETWMSANDAIKWGFADEIVSPNPAQAAPLMANAAITNALRTYKHVPPALQQQPNTGGPTDAEAQHLRDLIKLLV